MERFYFFTLEGLRAFDDRDFAEEAFDLCAESGMTPLFLIVVDGSTGDCEVEQWVAE